MDEEDFRSFLGRRGVIGIIVAFLVVISAILTQTIDGMRHTQKDSVAYKNMTNIIILLSIYIILSFTTIVFFVISEKDDLGIGINSTTSLLFILFIMMTPIFVSSLFALSSDDESGSISYTQNMDKVSIITGITLALLLISIIVLLILQKKFMKTFPVFLLVIIFAGTFSFGITPSS